MQYNYIKEKLENYGLKLKHYRSTESTMDTIKDLISNNNDCFFVIADSQIKGKGRRGNIWHSPKGNIYISFNLHMQTDIRDYFIYNIATSISITKTLDNICNAKSQLKSKTTEEITKATALFGDKLIRALEDGHAFAEGTCSERTFQKFNSLLDSVEQAAVKTNVQHI